MMTAGPVRTSAAGAAEAYSCRGNRAHLHQRGIKAVIPEKKDQTAHRKKKSRHVTHDAGLYTERNTVERPINKLKAWRGIATRCDKAPRELPRRTPPPRLHDLDQGLHPNHTMITTDYRP